MSASAGDPQIDIRPYRLGDADDLYAAVRESIAEVSPWLPWCHAGYSTDDARAWVEAKLELAEQGIEYAFGIRDAEGAYLGGCGLNAILPAHPSANLGYWVRTSQTRRGVATAAVRKLAAYAFDTLGLARVEIVCSVHNRGSQRVAEKAGALYEGRLHDRLWSKDGPVDAVLYALLRSRRPRPAAAADFGGAAPTDRVRLKREPLDSAVVTALIATLNAELKREYPGEGETFFRLDPDEVAEGRGAFLVAYVGDEPVGCGAIRKLDGTSAEIKRMFVRPEARGCGVGRRVLEALEAEARGLGVAWVVLETGPRQLRALALYESAGFARTPPFGDYVHSPISICMAKPVESAG